MTASSLADHLRQTSMPFEGFDVRLDDHVACVTIARPERRNALSNAMLEAMLDLGDILADDGDVRAVLLRGAGDKAFCAGFDLRELAKFDADHFMDNRFANVMERWANLTKPIIGAINGPCHGGGVHLAAACDRFVAVPGAVFAIPAARLGFAYPLKGIERIAQKFGPARAGALLYLDQKLHIDELQSTGMVHSIVPVEELNTHAMALASHCATLAPRAVAAMKTLVGAAPNHAEMHALYSAIAISDDLQEGMAARKEKRPPKFSGR